MKRLLLTVAAIGLLAAPAPAQTAGGLGVGVILGAPTGGTAKYYVRKTQAVDFAIGFNNDLTLHGDYLWHGWDVFAQPVEGKLGGYVGLGLRVRNRENDDAEFGFRTPGGVAYRLPRRPLEFFVELAPVFKLNARTGVDLDGAIGLRIFFPRK